MDVIRHSEAHIRGVLSACNVFFFSSTIHVYISLDHCKSDKELVLRDSFLHRIYKGLGEINPRISQWELNKLYFLRP